MHKNAQKVKTETQSKISCHYTWLLHGKIVLDDAFLEVFLTASKPCRRLKKRKEKEKKERRRRKFKKKIEKRKHVCHFLPHKLKIVISAHARAKMS